MADRRVRQSRRLAALALLVVAAVVGALAISSPWDADDATGIAVTSTTGTVTVPDLVGIPQREAKLQARAAELRPIVTTVENDSSPAGTVLSQSPPAGSEVRHEARISLVVAQ